MKSLFISLLAFLLSMQLVAQENYVPGMIITLKGDTVHGKINYLNWAQNPSSVWFLNNANQELVVYLPNELKAFKVGGYVYYGSEVEVETSSRDIGWMTSNPKLKLKTKVVFLKEVFKGPRSLYHYRDEKDVDFFYIKSDGVYKLLIYKQMLDYSSGNTSIRETKRYVGQLLYYMSDRPDIHGLIEKAQYTENSLLNVFEVAYPSQYKPKSTVQVKRTTYGVTLGLSSNRFVFTGASLPEFWNGVKSEPLTLTPSFFIEFAEPKNFGLWTFYSDLQFDSYWFQSSYTNDLYLIETKMKLDYLRMNNMLRYNIRLKKASLFVGGGLSSGYIIGEINTQKWYSRLYPERIETRKALDELRRLQTGIAFGLGASYKRFFLEGRMLFGSGPSLYPTLESEIRSASLIVGYRF